MSIEELRSLDAHGTYWSTPNRSVRLMPGTMEKLPIIVVFHGEEEHLTAEDARGMEDALRHARLMLGAGKAEQP